MEETYVTLTFDADTEIEASYSSEHDFYRLKILDGDGARATLRADGSRAMYNLLSAIESIVHGVQEDDLRDSADWLGNLPYEEEVVR